MSYIFVPVPHMRVPEYGVYPRMGRVEQSTLARQYLMREPVGYGYA
jgi:hypothetical protein